MKQRNLSIDAIRGLAVLLLFGVNIPIWSNSEVKGYSDFFASFLRIWLLDGWLYMSFAFCFGASIVLANQDKKRFLTRMNALFLIGMLHGLLLNYMDILAVYAVLGLIAYCFRKTSEKKLLLISFVLFAIPIVFYGIMAVIAPTAIHHTTQTPQTFLERAYLWFPMFFEQILFHGWEILGMMLLGMWAIRSKFFEGLSESRFSDIAIFLLISLALFACFQYAASNLANDGSMMFWFYAGMPALTIGVISLVAQSRLKFFAKFGNITLSLYLLQSVAGWLIFVVMQVQLSIPQELVLGLLSILVTILTVPIIKYLKPAERFYRFASTI